MAPVDRLASILLSLLRDGSMVGGRVTTSTEARLRSLFDCGALEWSPSGSGRRLTVKDAAAVERFALNHYPSGLTGLGDLDLPPVATAVANLRDAHRAKGQHEVALLRGFGDARIIGHDGRVVELAQLTRLAGAVAVVVGPGWHWRFEGKLALVENLEVFLHLERMGLDVDGVLRYAGVLSSRVLRWLASDVMSAARLLHLPDYDPVGLREHARLLDACPVRAALHVPADLYHAVEKFGKKRLLEDSVDLWQSVRLHSDPTIRSVARVLDAHGRGLEQESLLIARRPS